MTTPISLIGKCRRKEMPEMTVNFTEYFCILKENFCMEKEVEIELKNLEDVIKECHRLLFESEHILVITPKFSLDMSKVIETARAVFEKSDNFDGKMGLSKIIVEKFSKRMEKIEPLSVTKIHPGISKEMFEKEDIPNDLDYVKNKIVEFEK